jgi:cyd operon protein YbgT
MPQDVPLSYALPLTFIALLVPGLRSRPAIGAALVGGIAGAVFFQLPYKLGLMLAALLGILAGIWLEERP